jgi:hypothetical protein
MTVCGCKEQVNGRFADEETNVKTIYISEPDWLGLEDGLNKLIADFHLNGDVQTSLLKFVGNGEAAHSVDGSSVLSIVLLLPDAMDVTLRQDFKHINTQSGMTAQICKINTDRVASPLVIITCSKVVEDHVLSFQKTGVYEVGKGWRELRAEEGHPSNKKNKRWRQTQ